MPRAERLPPPLDSLLNEVFATVPDAGALLEDITALLTPSAFASTQRRVRKILRQRQRISPEAAVLTACILNRTGFPAHRVLGFLSVYLSDKISLSLFELAVDAIFSGGAPISPSLLYDLSQYTYLEKKILVRRGVEISEALEPSAGPELLLYLYLLTLRDDLSNENLQLIALVVANTFKSPSLQARIPGFPAEWYRGLARAWKIAEQGPSEPAVEQGGGAASLAGRLHDRDSASAFLDKYFSDKALAETRALAEKLSLTETPALAEKRPAAQTLARMEKQAGGSARAEAKPRTVAVAPRDQARLRRPARLGSRSTGAKKVPSAAAPRLAQSEKHGSRRARPNRRLSLSITRWVPVGAAVVTAAALLLTLPSAKRTLTADSGAPRVMPSPSAASASPAAPTVPAASSAAAGPSTTTYVVKPGDSLWKIFSVMRAPSPAHKGWADFLSTARTLNGLENPDRIRPGKVLTISNH